MIEVRIMYNINCNKCGKLFHSKDLNESYFGFVDFANELAEEEGWKVVQGKHICPDCQHEGEKQRTAECFKPQEKLD